MVLYYIKFQHCPDANSLIRVQSNAIKPFAINMAITFILAGHIVLTVHHSVACSTTISSRFRDKMRLYFNVTSLLCLIISEHFSLVI